MNTAKEELQKISEKIAELLQMPEDEILRLRMTDILDHGVVLDTLMIGTADEESPAVIIGWRTKRSSNGVGGFNVVDWADTPDLEV